MEPVSKHRWWQFYEKYRDANLADAKVREKINKEFEEISYNWWACNKFTNHYNAYDIARVKTHFMRRRPSAKDAYALALEIIRKNADSLMTFERWLKIRALFNRK